MNAIVKIGNTEYEPARLDRAGILAAAESGLFERLGRVEVIDGVIVKTSPSCTPHGRALLSLGSCFHVALAKKWNISIDQLVLFGEHGMRAPDIAFFDRGVSKKALDASDLRFVVEVSDTSIAYDLGDKAKTYARYGIPELWVVDLENETLVVHRQPSPEGYGSVISHGWRETVSPLIAPDFAVRLADILAD